MAVTQRPASATVRSHGLHGWPCYPPNHSSSSVGRASRLRWLEADEASWHHGDGVAVNPLVSVPEQRLTALEAQVRRAGRARQVQSPTATTTVATLSFFLIVITAVGNVVVVVVVSILTVHHSRTDISIPSRLTLVDRLLLLQVSSLSSELASLTSAVARLTAHIEGGGKAQHHATG